MALYLADIFKAVSVLQLLQFIDSSKMFQTKEYTKKITFVYTLPVSLITVLIQDGTDTFPVSTLLVCSISRKGFKKFL